MTTVTWLGQCGFYLDTGDLRILTDPYLSDQLQELEGPAMKRLVSVDPSCLELTFDVVLLTHDHLDHTDMPTLKRLLLQAPPATILASRNAFALVKPHCGKQHNYVLFDVGTEWTERGVRFKAVKAVHSDPRAVGALIFTKGCTIYLTGDTLYHEEIPGSITDRVDLMFAVMNGRGNNMNACDAARLVKRIRPKTAIPVHWGMFENGEDTPEAFCGHLAGSGIAVRILPFFKEQPLAELIKNEES